MGAPSPNARRHLQPRSSQSFRCQAPLRRSDQWQVAHGAKVQATRQKPRRQKRRSPRVLRRARQLPARGWRELGVCVGATCPGSLVESSTVRPLLARRAASGFPSAVALNSRGQRGVLTRRTGSRGSFRTRSMWGCRRIRSPVVDSSAIRHASIPRARDRRPANLSERLRFSREDACLGRKAGVRATATSGADRQPPQNLAPA